MTVYVAGGTSKGGAVDFDYTGLAECEYGWWYVVGGTIDYGYTGLVYDSNYGWWYVENGAINFGYTGLVYDSNCGWWYVENGAINFGYTGTVRKCIRCMECSWRSSQILT